MTGTQTDLFSQEAPLTKQQQRLLSYLKKHAGITPMEAWQILGIYRLSARVFELRRKGYDIRKVTAEVRNSFKEKCHVAKYSLAA